MRAATLAFHVQEAGIHEPLKLAQRGVARNAEEFLIVRGMTSVAL